MAASSLAPALGGLPAGADQIAPAVLTVEQWVHSLTFQSFGLLTPQQVVYLTPSQVASIPDASWFGRMSDAARAALNPAQVQSLKASMPGGIGLLNVQQRSWLSPVQIQSVHFQDFYFLSAAQTPLLTTSQIASMPAPEFFEWPAASRGALGISQVQAINVRAVGIHQLTPIQVSWLTVPQLHAVNVYQFEYLHAPQIPLLTTTQIAGMPNHLIFGEMSNALRAALTPVQVRALNVYMTRLGLLSPQQVGWLTISQIQTVRHQDFPLVNPAQMPHLTVVQIGSIPTAEWFGKISAAARAALTSRQIQSLSDEVLRLGLELLTPQQIGWLSVNQIQALPYTKFYYLMPVQIPTLTTAQIASVPDAKVLPPGSLNWLTVSQVRAFNVALTGLSFFSPQQIDWLTIPQIRSLSFYEFQWLRPGQIPLLNIAQIASIPNPYWLQKLSADSRAALTALQVRSINVASTGLEGFTPSQVAWLAIPQVQSLHFKEFRWLAPTQIPFLTPNQMRAVSDPFYLISMSDESRAALTRYQILSLTPATYAVVVSDLTTPPQHYHAAVENLPGPDGLPSSEHMVQEADLAFALAPREASTHVAVRNGNWTDPRIWHNGQVPSPGARVLIPAGAVVRFDAVMTAAIKTLRIDGTLDFAVNVSTQLKADTILVYTTGALHVGTASNPIRDNVNAIIMIADAGPIDRTWDPYGLSRGIVSRGEVTMHGRTVTPYTTLALNPAAGATTLTLNATPTNWRVGDDMVVSGTNPMVSDYETDRVKILAINGRTVTVTPLKYNHPTPPGFSNYLANLTRNVILIAEDHRVTAERPHLVFLHNPNVAIANIGVHGFGRTDKSIPINDPVVVKGVLQPGTGLNPRARYAMHFHHTGVHPDYAPASVRGSVAVDSPGWGFVNHSSNVVMEDNVAFGVYGAAFVTEDGNEIGAMRRNLALASGGSPDHMTARRTSHDFGFRGHGFWFQGPGIEVVDNIAIGMRDAAFIYATTSSKNLFDAVNLKDPSLASGNIAVPVGTVPLATFRGNIAAASSQGLEIWHHLMLMNEAQSVVSDFKAWNIRHAGIDLHYVGNLRIDNATLLAFPGVSGVGVNTNRVVHNIVMNNIHAEGFDVGIKVPVQGYTVINGGYLSAVQAIRIDKAQDALRTVNVVGNISFPRLSAARLYGRQQYIVYASHALDYTNYSSYRYTTFPEVVRLAFNGMAPLRIHYIEQQPSYVPFPAGAPAYVPLEYIGKTNQQLWQLFGVALGGSLLPPSVIILPGFHAVMTPEG